MPRLCALWYNRTMPSQNVLIPSKRDLGFRRELAYLYARRDALDKLIASLEAYGRYQPKTQVLPVKSRRDACA